ncbi:YbaK/EbsC family protein [[Kitasatospora] papulosa]|uniref:YbaK/EbsC family protein n=1 Tax=Streptomyces TaxID=1883 RepID=UPI0004BE31C6|nr:MULTISPECIES: YbaK/EbsC family protein [Streptomyces]MBD2831034.1 YbaK/EbsC family protein [Streptomyces pratensis]RAS26027.1 prolyl-tRNA editing enzyme YbaK/EbsC (Cys-tRNA(Pro) deacylase) [Streptomyces avidinii]SNX80504.1 Cys-tRNA(Pro) deacylase, prolyl-tRNA editing enzyme YbaK/EbsC [Streptomyces microflavus]MDX3185604.1 YbaK/EbsC family protein [Streptomyces sp. ME02-7008A-1]MDX3306707.1 YbaK/EbsC family protein [Streptomyces sp. ME02-7008A]
MRAPLGDFGDASPAADRLDLLTPPVAKAIAAGWGGTPAESVVFVDTAPEIADTAAFVEHHGPGLLDASANCVVVAGKRGGDTTLAACVVLSRTRVDVNGAVRKHLGTRKASFAPMDIAVGETGMEYGGITPIGLPAAWPLLVDPAVADTEWVLIGSGRRRGKLIVPGKALAALPGAVLLEGLGV